MQKQEEIRNRWHWGTETPIYFPSPLSLCFSHVLPFSLTWHVQSKHRSYHASPTWFQMVSELQCHISPTHDALLPACNPLLASTDIWRQHRSQLPLPLWEWKERDRTSEDTRESWQSQGMLAYAVNRHQSTPLVTVKSGLLADYSTPTLASMDDRTRNNKGWTVVRKAKHAKKDNLGYWK